jgi:hypothetical protein
MYKRVAQSEPQKEILVYKEGKDWLRVRYKKSD